MAESAADQAYRLAEEKIQTVRAAGGTRLELRDEPFLALDRIPDEIGILPGLEHLELNGTAIANLTPLNSLASLRTLTLPKTSVSDLSPLSKLSLLHQLLLNEAPVSDLTPLAHCKSLRFLILDGTNISDLSPLSELKDLHTLSVNETKVSDLSPISRLSGLQALSLDDSQVSDFSALAELKGLRSLWLDSTKISDLSALAELRSLRSLSLNATQISDLSPIARLLDLQSLQLDYLKAVDLSALSALTRLEHLSLEGSRVVGLHALAAFHRLEVLDLDWSGVDDLTPLANLRHLRHLSFEYTAVEDLFPLASSINLRSLVMSNSAVRDLRPLLALSQLGMDGNPGLSFEDTPATRSDPTLERLARVKDPVDRAEKTLAYLASLPPLQEPLKPSDDPMLTVEIVLKSQSPLGWRFSPSAGAMEVFAEASPTTAMQEQLAKMSGERAQALKKALAGANHGLRGEALQGECRFFDLLDDGSRPLSVRSVELWGSLVALGGLLDGNDVGRVQGRDPLDLLSVEQRAALQTLLQIAGNFVRSFPDVKALDDSAGGFVRRSITVEMVGAMIEAALRAAYVTPSSAALMQHVAAIGGTEGAQADKAASVSVRGIANLIQTAALFVGKGSIKLAGAAALGAAGYLGKEAADHYDLDKAAFAYVELIRDKVGPFLSNMQPDEAAVLQSALNDAEARLNERARQSVSDDSLRPELEQGRGRSDRPSTDLKKS